jgi:hypothetical protein
MVVMLDRGSTADDPGREVGRRTSPPIFTLRPMGRRGDDGPLADHVMPVKSRAGSNGSAS